MFFKRINRTFICLYLFCSIGLCLNLGVGRVNAFAVPLEPNPLRGTARLTTSKLSLGQNTMLVVDLQLPAGYRAYLDRFELYAVQPANIKISSLQIQPVIRFQDVVSGKMKDGVIGQFQLSTAIEIPTDLPPKTSKLAFNLKYQSCTEKFCLTPKNLPLTVRVQIKD